MAKSEPDGPALARGRAVPGEAHARAAGLLPAAPPHSIFEAAARVIAAARQAVAPIECAYCHLPAMHCERQSHDCRLGDLRRALRQLDEPSRRKR